MVWVAFESVELDAVQLLETLPAALTREIVLHLCRVLLHVPVERSTLSALVAADLALQGCLASVRATMYFQVVLPFEGFATGLTGEFTDT